MTRFSLVFLAIVLIAIILPATLIQPAAAQDRTVTIDDHDAAFVYTGGGWWSYGPLDIFSGLRAHQASEKQLSGAADANTATVTFTGKNAALITMVGPGCGKLTWSLDNGAQTGEIDCRKDAIKSQAVIPVVQGLPDTEHKLAFTPEGPPPKSADQPDQMPEAASVWIDGLQVVTATLAFDVTSAPAPSPVGVTITLDPPDGLAELGKTFTVKIKVDGGTLSTNAKIAYYVFDLGANSLAQGEDTAALAPNKPFEKTVQVKPTAYGQYQIQVKVTAVDGGAFLAEGKSGIVALQPRNPVYDKGCQYGAELHPGDEAAVPLMKKIGLAHALVRVDWAAHEPQQGQFAYPLDSIIDAAKAAGLTVAAVVEGKPAWATGTPEEFGALMQAVAAHYGSKVEGYQLLDAVNTGLHPLAPTPDAYVAFATAGGKAIRAAAPGVKVGIGGFVHAPGEQDWIDNMSEILRKISAGLVDVIGVRGYAWGTPEVEEYSARITSIYASKQNFARLPMWVTSVGAATAPAGVWSSFAWSESMQARETVKDALTAFTGRATRIYLRDLVDHRDAGPLAGAGLFYSNGQPKVAAGMVATMTAVTNGAKYPILQRMGRRAYIILMQHKDVPTVLYFACGTNAKEKVFTRIPFRMYALEVDILDAMGNARKAKTQSELIDFMGTEMPEYVLGGGPELPLPTPPDDPEPGL